MRFREIAGESGIFLDGDWIEKKDQDENGRVRLIQLADIGTGVFRDKSDRYITEEKAKELNCTMLHKGDILIARLGEPLCKACVFPYDGLYITAVDVAILRICNSIVNPNYLVFLLNSPWFKEQVKKYESGTTRKRISRKNLEQIEMVFPPLPEQERIVARIEELFSQLDAGVETLKKTKAQLAVYRQAVLK
ncbi:MAG: restriction endonuclease subunit S, partial [Clostridia bacterium]|nr:restriction endonuclease subunit S [Clostridia bacterium]